MYNNVVWFLAHYNNVVWFLINYICTSAQHVMHANVCRLLDDLGIGNDLGIGGIRDDLGLAHLMGLAVGL